MVHPIAEVFLRKISFPEKIVWKTVPWGGPQSGTVRFEKNIFFTLNSNISWFLNDKSKFFSVIKNWDLKYFRHFKNIYVENCLLSITATSKRFFAFSRKTREIFGNYFLIYHRTWLEKFFPVLFRGVTYNVSLEKLKKRPKNANFLNIHQI